MPNSDWGLIEETLQPYVLRVSGDSGCNLFMEGDPARAVGSAAARPQQDQPVSGVRPARP